MLQARREVLGQDHPDTLQTQLNGVVNLVAVIIIARLTVSGFASVWCGWAAVSSAAITLHCRVARPHAHRAELAAR